MAAAVVAAGLLVTPLAAAAEPATYADATGDSASAPDLAQIAIADNGTNWGFEIDLATDQDLADGAVVIVALDTDRNRATGDPSGADYAIFASADRFALDRWDGERFGPIDHAAASPALSDGKLTFTLTKADVGSPARFDFRVVSLHGSDEDDAPNGNAAFSWPAGSARIAEVLLPATALAPHAGTIFSVRGLRAQLTDGTTARPRVRGCSLTLAGRGLKRVGACAWRVPKTVRGRTLLLDLAVAVGAQHAATTFELRVR